MQRIRLGWRDPDAVLAAWADEPWLACLDSGGPVHDRARWTILCRRPTRTLLTQGAPGTDAVRALLGPPCHRPRGLPFEAGVIGFASYEVGLGEHGLTSRHAPAPGPGLAAAFYDRALVFDRLRRDVWLTTPFRDVRLDPSDVPERADPPRPVPPATFTADQDGASYRAMVAEAVERIHAGDLFQLNLTSRYTAPRPEGLSPMALYRALRARAPAPFGAFLGCGGGFSLLSSSVERFIHMTAQGRMQTRPVKGTAPRAADPGHDSAALAALRADEKERAENLMIVDLMRNDLGRMARIGSVEVPSLFEVETFAHVHHLVSEVRASLRQDSDAIDLLAATLPPGSVTGAPKRQALTLIDTLEASARGPYCGVVFRLGTDGSMDSSVIIRSLTMDATRIQAGAGGGITALSDPSREYDEMRLKIAPLLALFGQTP
ncbi:para-aminobenzoate synthase component I [Ameyamaea chiangmaiensis NBRC 103196]|nr:anthranilate synthase component I family protein [Ameyamaea chiangmaiensis]MBS4075313.1 anthranilate synthase component I family protein [Ameyamaea chiangmaiensis]GBQ66728.1 para-aminobenzoate synthase component I [Ameyamaea chiangmaiensis NBRC 103196]